MKTRHIPRIIRLWPAVVMALAVLTWVEIAVADEDLNRTFIGAAMSGDVELIKTLLDKGVDVNAKDQYGQIALITAAQEGQFGAVRLLLERGADVNARDHRSWTALMYAADAR